MDLGELLIGALCLAPFVGLIVWLAVGIPLRAEAEKKRGHALWQWANANGWHYTRGQPALWTAYMPGANARGVGAAVSATIDGYRVTVAEYSFKTTRTDSDGHRSSTTHHLLATIVHLPRPYPAMAVVQRGPISKVGRSLFGDGVTATGDEVFDGRFRVHCVDPRQVATVIGPDLIAAHLALAVPPWRIAGTELLVHSIGKLPDPEGILSRATALVRVASMLGIPTYPPTR